MYTRVIQNAPDSVVRSGQPIFGDFDKAPDFFDIRKLKQPFSLMPLPSFFTDSRIRSNLCFTFLTEAYMGTMEIMDANYFGFAEINMWEKETGRKVSYRSFIVFRKRLIPRRMKSGICKSFRSKRIFAIRWDYETGKFSVLCRLKGDKTRPDISFAFSANLQEERCGVYTAVVPAPLMRRCAATHHCAPFLKGSLSGGFFAKDGQTGVAVSDAASLFTVRTSYYRLRLHCFSVTGLGNVDGANIRFNLYTSNQDAVDSDLYNENVLFADTQLSPLPPVTITHPYGLSGQWIIQDTENMVDLTFNPLSDTVRKESILILRTEYRTIYGTCEGVIRDRDGRTFTLKDFCTIVKKQYLRL